jgi:peptide/nickel transport system permease protein
VRAYVIRRLLVMVPTFVGISLVLFLVLNLAPGRPGAAQPGADLAADIRGERTQESYRIFREQFHLDKPVLFNTRFALDPEEVGEAVRLAAGARPGSAAERVRAQEQLEDFGYYAVPHLLRVAREADAAGERRVRDVAAYFLRLNARRPLEDPFDPDPSEALKARNRALEAENARVRGLRYALEDPEERKREVLDAWEAWYRERRADWDYDGLDRLRILFLETRFAAYWRNLLRLDFGVSLVSREPVVATLLRKIRYSLSLSVSSLLLAYLVSIPLGIYSAVFKDSRSDRSLTASLFMLYSLPSFFAATLLLYFFSSGSDYESLRLFPTGGWRSRDADSMTSLQQIRDVAWHLVLPILCLTYGSLAALSRYMRTGLLDVIRSDYVRTARAKGLSEWRVIGKHAVRNGLLPILTLLGGLLPAVLGGSVIIEYIFGIPGMGLWVVESIYQRDYNAIMAIQLFSTVLVLVGLLLTDLSYALVDPRIRYE